MLSNSLIPANMSAQPDSNANFQTIGGQSVYKAPPGETAPGQFTPTPTGTLTRSLGSLAPQANNNTQVDTSTGGSSPIDTSTGGSSPINKYLSAMQTFLQNAQQYGGSTDPNLINQGMNLQAAIGNLGTQPLQPNLQATNPTLSQINQVRGAQEQMYSPAELALAATIKSRNAVLENVTKQADTYGNQILQAQQNEIQSGIPRQIGETTDVYGNKIAIYGQRGEDGKYTPINGDGSPIKYVNESTVNTSDPNLIAQAIKSIESGGNPNKTGESGEVGAYQFMPDTWKSMSQAYAKANNIDNISWAPTPAHEDAVAKWQIGQWLAQGLNAAQIFSMWNSGNPDPRVAGSGVNKAGVPYDAPGYTAKGLTALQALLGTNQTSNQPTSQGSDMVNLNQLPPILQDKVRAMISLPDIHYVDGSRFLPKALQGFSTHTDAAGFALLDKDGVDMIDSIDAGLSNLKSIENRIVKAGSLPTDWKDRWATIPRNLLENKLQSNPDLAATVAQLGESAVRAMLQVATTSGKGFRLTQQEVFQMKEALPDPINDTIGVALQKLENLRNQFYVNLNIDLSSMGRKGGTIGNSNSSSNSSNGSTQQGISGITPSGISYTIIH